MDYKTTYKRMIDAKIRTEGYNCIQRKMLVAKNESNDSNNHKRLKQARKCWVTDEKRIVFEVGKRVKQEVSAPINGIKNNNKELIWDETKEGIVGRSTLAICMGTISPKWKWNKC